MQFELPAIAGAQTQPAPRLIVGTPLAEGLAQGKLVLQYRPENIRIVEAYGPEALAISPRIGHLHVTVDDAPWHWVDASGMPIIVQGLSSGAHRIRLDLADAMHRVIDSHIVAFEIPSR